MNNESHSIESQKMSHMLGMVDQKKDTEKHVSKKAEKFIDAVQTKYVRKSMSVNIRSDLLAAIDFAASKANSTRSLLVEKVLESVFME